MFEIKAQAMTFFVTIFLGAMTGALFQEQAVAWYDYLVLLILVLIPLSYISIPLLLARRKGRTKIAGVSLAFWLWGHIAGYVLGVLFTAVNW